MLSFLSPSQNVVEPGEQFDFTWEVETTEPSDDVQFIVEIYDCYDSGCDDPDRDEFVEAVYTDISETYTPYGPPNYGSVRYNVPSDANPGTWGAVVYIWDNNDGKVISDTPETTFGVDAGSDTSSGDEDTTDDTSQQGDDGDRVETDSPADVYATQRPEVTVEDGVVEGRVYFENRGDDMEQRYIVEMQVRKQGVSPLSTVFDRRSKTCDPAHPENVHKEFRLNGGDSTSITLRTDAVKEGDKHNVYFLTRSACAQDRDGAGRVNPYPYAYNAGTICIDCADDEDWSTNEFIALVALLAAVGLIITGVVINRG